MQPYELLRPVKSEQKSSMGVLDRAFQSWCMALHALFTSCYDAEMAVLPPSWAPGRQRSRALLPTYGGHVAGWRSKRWCDVQHSSQRCCVVYLKVAKRVDPESSHHKEIKNSSNYTRLFQLSGSRAVVLSPGCTSQLLLELFKTSWCPGSTPRSIKSGFLWMEAGIWYVFKTLLAILLRRQG